MEECAELAVEVDEVRVEVAARRPGTAGGGRAPTQWYASAEVLAEDAGSALERYGGDGFPAAKRLAHLVGAGLASLKLPTGEVRILPGGLRVGAGP